MYHGRMGVTTNRLGMYLPGGGSSSIGGADEPLDVDKLNENIQKLDDAVGTPVYTSTTRPVSPYPGQIILETDTGNVMIWDTGRTPAIWAPIDRNWKQQANPGTASRKVGDIWTSWA